MKCLACLRPVEGHDDELCKAQGDLVMALGRLGIEVEIELEFDKAKGLAWAMRELSPKHTEIQEQTDPRKRN